MRIRPIKGAFHQRLLAVMLRQDVVACARCGLQSRQSRAGARADAARDCGTVPESSATSAIDLDGLDRALDRSADTSKGQSLRRPS
jgi:hypothetical protein